MENIKGSEMVLIIYVEIKYIFILIISLYGKYQESEMVIFRIKYGMKSFILAVVKLFNCIIFSGLLFCIIYFTQWRFAVFIRILI